MSRRLLEKTPQYTDNLNCFLSCYRTDSATLSEISSRPITNFGIWSQVEYCPWGTYIVGISLKADITGADKLGLTGVKLYCSAEPWTSHVHSYPTDYSNFTYVTSGLIPSGKWGKVKFCTGLAYGFQLKVESYQGPFGDDTTTNNIQLLCADIETGNQMKLEGDGGPYGQWRETYECPLGEALCGVQTQIDLKNSSK